MKFLLDMPVSPKMVDWLKALGHEAVHARTLGLSKAPDEKILKSAKESSQIILTMDLDFPAILFRMRNPRRPLMQDRLILLFRTHLESQLAFSITVIKDDRIRIRSLPLH